MAVVGGSVTATGLTGVDGAVVVVGQASLLQHIMTHAMDIAVARKSPWNRGTGSGNWASPSEQVDPVTWLSPLPVPFRVRRQPLVKE